MNSSKLHPKTLLRVFVLVLIPGFLSAQTNFTGIIEKDGKYGIEIKLEGETKQVVKPKYDGLRLIFEDVVPRYYAYKLEGKWGILYREGKGIVTVTKPEYDDIKLLNDKANFVFDLKQRYFLVWKAGKVALLSYPNEGKVELSQFWDDIGIDTVKFAVNYLSLFKIKSGNLYGVGDLFGRVVAKAEYESYEKFDFNGYNNFHLLKKDHRYLIVADKKKVWGEELRPADTAWYENNTLFSITGKDTVVHYPYGTETISAYRKKQAEHEAYMQARGQKDDAQKLKQEKVTRILNAKYQKKERVFLSGNREMYLLIDTFGIKCFNPETADFVFADKQLEHYYIKNTLVFVQSDKGKWYLYPNDIEYKSIKTVGHLVAAQVSDEQYWIFGGVRSRQVYVEKGAEITEVTTLDNSVHVVYRINGKYGFVSQDNNGYKLKSLPAVFSSISIISTYQNNPRLELVYNGETVNAYHDNIQMEFGGKHVAIKADMYGAKCSNPNCKNGVVGTTTRVEKGETVTKQFNNTTYWYKGHLVPADITIIETNPDRVITEKTYCEDPIHSVKLVMLFWDAATGTYKVEKH